jgi:hypothetical protein
MMEPSGRKKRAILARGIAYAMEMRAVMLGVSMHVEARGDSGLTFVVMRHPETRPGHGAYAIGDLLEMADAAGLEVMIDVRREDERLFSYYHDFGFRLVDGDPDRERDEIVAILKENGEWKASGRDIRSLGVISMHRDPWSGPLATEQEVLSVTGTLSPTRTKQERSARHRDVLLALLQIRGMTAGGAGARMTPVLTAEEVSGRMSQRRKEGWTIPLFTGHTAAAA